jgi:hypothetical protein
MSKITDYAFLFQKSFGTSGVNAIGSFQLSQLNSSSVQAQLKAAGINTNSKQYKSAVKQWCNVWQYSGNKKSDESL